MIMRTPPADCSEPERSGAAAVTKLHVEGSHGGPWGPLQRRRGCDSLA